MLGSYFTIPLSLALTASAAPRSLHKGRGLPTCAPEQRAGQYVLPLPGWVKSTPNGQPFCTSRWDQAQIVTGLSTYSKKDSSGNCAPGQLLQRLEVQYGDGTVVAIGGDNKDCPTGQIHLVEGDKVTKYANFQLGTKEYYYGPGHIDVRLPQGAQTQGVIYIETVKDNNKGSQILQDAPLAIEYGPDVESQDQNVVPKWSDYSGSTVKGGVMTGVEGYVDGDVINFVNFHWTNSNLVSAKRDNFKYDLSSAGIKSVVWDTKDFSNTGDQNATYTMKDKTSVAWTYSINLGVQTSLGDQTVSVDEEQKVPKIFATYPDPVSGYHGTDSGDLVGYQWSDSYDTVKDMSGSAWPTWDHDITLSPGEKAECYAGTGRHDGDIPFTSDLTLVFDDKSTKVRHEKGILAVEGMTGDVAFYCKRSGGQTASKQWRYALRKGASATAPSVPTPTSGPVRRRSFDG